MQKGISDYKQSDVVRLRWWTILAQMTISLTNLTQECDMQTITHAELDLLQNIETMLKQLVDITDRRKKEVTV